MCGRLPFGNVRVESAEVKRTSILKAYAICNIMSSNQLRQFYGLLNGSSSLPGGTIFLTAAFDAPHPCDAVDLENVLRKINTDCDNFIHGRLLIPCGS